MIKLQLRAHSLTAVRHEKAVGLIGHETSLTANSHTSILICKVATSNLEMIQ